MDGCSLKSGGRAVGRAIQRGQVRRLLAEVSGQLAAQNSCSERKQEFLEVTMKQFRYANICNGN